MTRILLLGKEGRLGWELARLLPDNGQLHAYDRHQADLTQLEPLRELVRQLKPEIVINAAAYTDVDRAESEPDLCLAVNSAAPALLAEETARLGGLFVHFSTDYVFDGNSQSPYVEQDPARPLNQYGRAKLAGEQAIQAINGRYLILRASWLYGLRRRSFVTNVLHWAGQQRTIEAPDDQWGSPTWCRLLARAATHAVLRFDSLGDSAAPGIYHLACRGAASRYALAKAVLDVANIDPAPELERAKTIDFPSVAQRPRYSALNSSLFEATFDFQLPDWRACLQQAFSSEFERLQRGA